MFKDYNTAQVVLPLNLEIMIDPDDISVVIDHFVESLPNDTFDVYERATGRPAYHPKMMIKLTLCAYAQGIRSGRKIEELTKDSIRMRWLARDNFPSYRTINRFRIDENTAKLLETCFVQFRSLLVESGEINEDAIFIDGTKIQANANKNSFVWRKSIERNEKNLDEKSKALYQELVENEVIPAIESEQDELSIPELKKIEDHLDQVVTKMDNEISSEKSGARRKEIRSLRKAPKQWRKHFKEAQERKANYAKQKEILGERNSYSKTDQDATFMRLKEDHMQNGQLKAAYNIQVATNNQYTLTYASFPNPTDTRTLIPFLTAIQERFFELPKYIVADAGYGSEENYQAVMDDFERVPLMTYNMQRKEQTKKYKKDPFKVGNWEYDEENDQYTCPDGRDLIFKNYSVRTDKYGFQRNLEMYQCEDCTDCPVRNLCTKAQSDKPRVIQKNPNLDYFQAYARELLSVKETGDIYRQRKIDVEPTFGNLKANLGFTRFLVRGKEAVENELGFALMAMNIKKYTKKRATTSDSSRISKQKIVVKIFCKILITIFQFLRLFKGYVPASSSVSIWKPSKVSPS